MIDSLSPYDGETLEEYTARMAALIEETELESARRIDDLKLIVFALQTARRENRPLLEYLPEDHWLRFEPRDGLRRRMEALEESVRTGRPMKDCLNDRFNKSDDPG